MSSKAFRSYILAGLVVWLPILITFVVLRFIIDILDKTVALLPKAYQPEQLLGIPLPGLGIVLSLILLIVTGMIATNFLGARLVRVGEIVLTKIPLVRTVYMAAKQVIQAIFSANGQSFRKVLLIEYPRKGLWSLAFLTSSNNPELLAKTGQEMLSVFIPTTPNPTSGFLMMVPKAEVIELSMTVDEALKLIISLGVMQPQASESESMRDLSPGR